MGSWDTDSSSGFLTGFTGTVEDSFFGTDPRYNNGETLLLQWEITVGEVTQDDYDGEVPETLTVSFPCGKDWITEDGVTAEHPRGKETFHSSSIYGKLIDAVTGKVANYGDIASRTDGADLEVELGPLMAMLEERGDPTDASVWKGLELAFAEVCFDYGENRKTGERMVANRTMPVGVVGETKPKPKAKAAAKKATKAKAKPAAEATEATEAKADTAKERAAAAKAKAAAKKAAAAKEAGEPDADDPFAFVDDAELRTQLNDVLAGSDDFNAFVDAILEIEAVATNDDLLEKCMEDDGPWASKA